MAQMRAAIERIGQPQRERREAQRVVETAVAGRVAVQHLVLQGAMPGDQPDERGIDQNGRQGGVPERQRRPFDGRHRAEFVRRGPEKDRRTFTHPRASHARVITNTLGALAE